jgi:Meiotically up-regulated gene 113
MGWQAIRVLRVMNKQHILTEIKRTAATNGGVPLGVSKFSKETGIKDSDWSGKIWARWGDALREAGFEPNQLQTAYSEDMLIEKFIGLARELGRFPVASEVKMKARSDDGFPWHNTFARFGSKQQFATRILDYCKARAGYEDIIALCTPIATVAREKAAQDEIEPEEIIGFVYLMKSGRHYKIGRSNATGRREYELAIQMPEKLTTVHTIRTDDPAGIEDYWHRRFAEKRKNGEWFDLAGADVKAFKRRKFM